MSVEVNGAIIKVEVKQSREIELSPKQNSLLNSDISTLVKQEFGYESTANEESDNILHSERKVKIKMEEELDSFCTGDFKLYDDLIKDESYSNEFHDHSSFNDQCNNTTPINQSRTTKKNTNIKNLSSEIKCSLCNYTTKIKRHLNQHNILKHNSLEYFRCNQCNYVAKNKRNLNWHLLRHKIVENLKCYQCDYKTKDNLSFRKHLLNHTSTVEFKCDKCDYATKSKKYLKWHFLKHTSSSSFQCNTLKCEQTDHVMEHKNLDIKCGRGEYATNIERYLKHVLKHDIL